VQKCLEEGDLKLLNELLELEDNELWDIVSGRSDRFEVRFGGIVARLRAV
jgi:succinate dehydrogenase flavin-adding protein (antitoxin of CptAB toxin-antitoxin module)